MIDDAAREVKQLCTFSVDGLQFAVDVTQVQEVIRLQEMTPVPLAPRVVTGLINLRGQIVTALDLRVRLGLPPRAPGALAANVVLRLGDAAVSLVVDDIGDVLEVDQELFEPPPHTLPADTKALIRGVYKLAPQLLMLLDTARVMRIEPPKNTPKELTWLK